MYEHLNGMSKDDALTSLRILFPRWEIWHVPVYIGPNKWCARVWGAPIGRFAEDSAAWLADELATADKEITG